MLVYLAVLGVVALVGLAYWHGVFMKVTTKDSEFKEAICVFSNVQRPYNQVHK